MKQTRSRRIPLAKPIVTEEQKKAVLRVLDSGNFILGEENEKLEKEFSKYCGARYAVAVNSGTAALHLSLLALGLKAGDEIISVSNTFIATANAILFCGGRPVFVDIDPETYTINPEGLEEHITEKTKAIIPVHLYGHPADMDPILEIAKKHDLIIIEDACQAHGAKYKNRSVGSLGDVTCFSFYPSKNMTVCGDGGIIVTNNEEVAAISKILRNQGQRIKDHHERVGFTMRLSEIHAAIAREQLKHLDEWNELRRKNASIYNHSINENPEVKRPIEKEWARHVYYYYVLQTPRRNKLKEFLEGAGISVGIHYPTPIHLQPAYEKISLLTAGSLPVTETAAQQVLSIPCHPSLLPQDVRYVAENINKFLS